MYEEKEIKYKKRKKEKVKFNFPKIEKKNTPDIFNKINWKQLFFKLFLLVVVMILIIFVISRISKNSKENDLVINNNLDKITNAAISFYTYETLPHNVGDSTSLLLDEMIKKNLIDIIEDKQGNVCNTLDSYIIITKTTEEEYRLKIYLSCPKEEKTIEKDLICTTNCQIKK